jgi:hypothetical protein
LISAFDPIISEGGALCPDANARSPAWQACSSVSSTIRRFSSSAQDRRIRRAVSTIRPRPSEGAQTIERHASRATEPRPPWSDAYLGRQPGGQQLHAQPLAIRFVPIWQAGDPGSAAKVGLRRFLDHILTKLTPPSGARRSIQRGSERLFGRVFGAIPPHPRAGRHG